MPRSERIVYGRVPCSEVGEYYYGSWTASFKSIVQFLWRVWLGGHGRHPLLRFVIRRCWRAKRRRRLSSCATAGVIPDSRLSAPWLVVRKVPVVLLASWLTNFWISSRRPTMPWAFSPFHHSSAPKRAAARTHADWTRLQFSGDRPTSTCPRAFAAGSGRSWPSSSGSHGVPSESAGSRATRRATGWPVR